MEPAKKDFEELINFLHKKYNIKLNKEEKAVVKSLHQRIYSLCLIEFELKRNKKIKTFFIYEARSDSIKLIPLLIMGFRKEFFLLNRSIIECVLRFIFYEDHPAKYKLLNINSKSRIDIENLFDYVKNNPDIRGNKKMLDLISRIKKMYAESSRFIHTANKSFSSSKKTLSEIMIKEEELKKLGKNTNKLFQELITLLLYLKKEDAQNFHPDNKKFLLQTLSKTERRVVHDLT